jgi:hypothetical protein
VAAISRSKRSLLRERAARRTRAAGVTAHIAAGMVGGMVAHGAAQAVDLPADRAEALVHVYDGGGVRSTGPALLVRKSLADRVSLSGTYYVDMVSNASIDVVTTASPFKERRTAVDLGVDFVHRDALITLSTSRSDEPDYLATSTSLDLAQEMFGGMTTVSLGFTRARDEVGKKNAPEFADLARHWQYRLGLTQILTPTWLASANLEVVSDEGFLGSPYRVARVFGAAVPERNPRTRTSRAVKFRSISEFGERSSVRAEYRYFWDTWDIRAHTVELGYSRYFGEPWLADAMVRVYSQDKALFYSDNATGDTTYVSRNRQLSTFKSYTLGAKLAYTAKTVPGRYEIKLNGSVEAMRFRFSDFTDLRTGNRYAFNASLWQLYVTATF